MFYALNQLAQPEIRETPTNHECVPVIKRFFCKFNFNALLILKVRDIIFFAHKPYKWPLPFEIALCCAQDN
jgi:hypothetical protein